MTIITHIGPQMELRIGYKVTRESQETTDIFIIIDKSLGTIGRLLQPGHSRRPK